MKKRIFLGLAACIAVSVLVFTACNDNTDVVNPQKAGVSFHLKDNPGDYDAVYVDIQQVELTMEGQPPVVYSPIRPGVYDLLKFRNGMDTVLLWAELPAGKINQMRLILGANNSVVVDGQAYPMTTPSAQESGLKLNLNQEFAPGGSYDIWIDFDAGKSIVKTGNDKYILKPVIRAYSSLTDGRLKGYVLPAAAMTTVYATNGTDEYTAIPDAHGYFMFTGLPEGNYKITYDASVALYTDITLNNINVAYGQTTDLGTTVLVP